MSNTNNKVLVVDNDSTIVFVLERALAGESYNVDTVNNGKKALAMIENGDYSLIIMDINMPVMDGLTALQKIRELDSPPEVIMITAHSSMENTVEAMKLGAFDFIVKPFELDEVLDLAGRALEKYKSRRHETLSAETESSGKIIGNSPAMRELYKILGRVASTDTSVLITGETGTGKDLFSRAIHYHSARKEKPFITVNCASIPAELLESELFGHVKGAFTGAIDSRPGKCELADGGSLFLDEIGTMRHDLQAKLLRFLQHNEFERVGSSVTQKVDVRVIAATNANLTQMTEEGQFREDLYYRLMVVPITIIPLRERKEDIPDLARYFVDKFNKQYSLNFNLTQAHLDSMLTRDWPGNVRELENYIHRTVVLQSEHLNIEDDIISGIPGQRNAEDIDSIVSGLVESGYPDLLEVARERIEKPLLTKVMSRVRGNQSEAAKLLGISRNTLRKMLDKYDVFSRD